MVEPNELLEIEHDLIKRIFPLVRKQVRSIEETERVDSNFIQLFTDFFTTYLDVAHHGKEEDILFEEMKKKNLSKEHEEMMQELIDEHKLGRELIKEVLNKNGAYVKGDITAIDSIIKNLKKFNEIYEEHIDKEDNDYFVECMDYFSREEQDKMVQDFLRFDVGIIHERYREILDMLEKEEVGKKGNIKSY